MSPILRLCVTITAFPEASYGQEQGSTSWFYLNSTITPLLVGDIYVCVFLNSLGGKHLGVTLWASRICPLHNFFLLGRSLRELVSLREGRNSCGPSPGRPVVQPGGSLPLLAQSLPWGPLPLLLDFWCVPQFSCIRKKPTLSMIPYLKPLGPHAFQNLEVFTFRKVIGFFCRFWDNSPSSSIFYFCNIRYTYSQSGINEDYITPIQIRFYCQINSENVVFWCQVSYKPLLVFRTFWILNCSVSDFCVYLQLVAGLENGGWQR